MLVLIMMPAHAQEGMAGDADAAYNEAMRIGTYAEAEVAAKKLLDHAIGDGLQNELSTAQLLSKLALAQRHNKNYQAALQNYKLAVSIIESKTDMLGLSLIDPLLGISHTHIDNERPDLAMEYAKRALHVRHVNSGPHSIEQTASLDVLITAHRKMDAFQDALALTDRLHLLYQREFPGKSMELVPILVRKGQLLGATGNRREERNAYNDAIEIVEHNEGKASKHLAQPLINLGKSHEQEYFDLYFSALTDEDRPDTRLLSKARSYYEQALELPDGSNTANPRSQCAALIALADFYTVTNKHSSARLLYKEAWQQTTEQANGLETQCAKLDAVYPLLRPPADLSLTAADIGNQDLSTTSFDSGILIAKFTVTSRGQVKEIRLVEISPDRNEAIEAKLKSALGRYIFRPRFENGLAVETPDEVIRFEFPLPRVASGTQ
jgi:hypothetical protein